MVSGPRIRETVGGENAWLEVYGLMSLSRPRFYSATRRALADYTAYADLGLDLQRMRAGTRSIDRSTWGTSRTCPDCC